MDLDLILRTSALLAMAAPLARVLHSAAPATRHFVWHAAIVMVILTPLLTPLAPRFSVPMVPKVPGFPGHGLRSAGSLVAFP